MNALQRSKQREQQLVEVRADQHALIEHLRQKLAVLQEAANYRKNILVEIALDPTDSDLLAQWALLRFPQ